MDKYGRYVASDNMSDMVSDNYRILLVMSRFGIGLGFGDKTVDEVCRDSGVDTDSFLAVSNLILENASPESYIGKVSPESLMIYLHNSHDYFLGFRLPCIRRELVKILGDAKDELSKAVLRYFDEYVDEVRKHMSYEEDTVFPYVKSLLEGRRRDKYNIGIFSKHHDQVEARLKEFKRILIKYYPAKSTNELNGVLFDIFNCESDLASHNEVEDRLFVPIIKEIELNGAGAL